MSETKVYKLDGDLTVQFEEAGAFLSSVNGSVSVFLTWTALDALDEARRAASSGEGSEDEDVHI